MIDMSKREDYIFAVSTSLGIVQKTHSEKEFQQKLCFFEKIIRKNTVRIDRNQLLL